MPRLIPVLGWIEHNQGAVGKDFSGHHLTHNRAEANDVAKDHPEIEIRPSHKHLPAQRIHLDICAIPSRDPRPMMLRNLYGIDLGTSGLILQAQSREEILANKVIALAFLENRIKNATFGISLGSDSRASNSRPGSSR